MLTMSLQTRVLVKSSSRKSVIDLIKSWSRKIGLSNSKKRIKRTNGPRSMALRNKQLTNFRETSECSRVRTKDSWRSSPRNQRLLISVDNNLLEERLIPRSSKKPQSGWKRENWSVRLSGIRSRIWKSRVKICLVRPRCYKFFRREHSTQRQIESLASKDSDQ